MRRIFVTADTHFGHEAIIRICNRPFSSVEEMDEALIANWNTVVSPSDEVWHLGDFAMKASAEKVAEIFGRLNGRKHLVIGNHDRLKTTSLRWASKPRCRAYLHLPEERLPVVLDHYALRTWPSAHHGAIHLYGHSHGTLPGMGRSLDVGVDCWDFRPVTLDELRPTLERQHEEFERQLKTERLFRERAGRGDPALALALAILRRVPDVGDELLRPQGSRVVEDPEIMSGEPCVSGTRVPARTVLAYLKAGHTDLEIFKDYPSLSVDGITAVRQWAAELGFGLPGD